MPYIKVTCEKCGAEANVISVNKGITVRSVGKSMLLCKFVQHDIEIGEYVTPVDYRCQEMNMAAAKVEGVLRPPRRVQPSRKPSLS
jgi:hypothetical protein